MNFLYCFYCNFIVGNYKIKDTINSKSSTCLICETRYSWYYENKNIVLAYINIALNNDLTFCFDILKNEYFIYKSKWSPGTIYSPVFESHNIGNIIHLSIQEIRKKFLNLLPFI